MTMPAALRWTLLALAGLAVAVAVAIAASNLITSERIGLASEPLRAGEALAPASADRGDGRGHHRGRHRERNRGSGEPTTTALPPTTTAPATTVPTTPAPTAPPTDDSSVLGSDDGAGGSGGDD